MPPLFMQVTSINANNIHIKVNTTEVIDFNSGFLIKDINGNDNPINEQITIDEKTNCAEVDVKIDEKHDGSYHLALFESHNMDYPVLHSNQLKFNILRNKNLVFKKYKPMSIDISKILKVKNDKNKKIHIYWSIPSESFGNISYKIIKDKTDKKETDVDENVSYNQQQDIIKYVTVQIEDKDDQLLNKYKDKIIEYFTVNKMNYDKLNNMQKKQFCKELADYCGNKKLTSKARNMFPLIQTHVVKAIQDMNSISMCDSLPFTIPYTSLPISLKVITISTVDGKKYRSDASESISVHEPIKLWEEFPNLLQVLSIDEDIIEIKFTLKTPTMKKTKYLIESIDNQISAMFMIKKDEILTKKQIEVRPNEKYTFAVFDRNKMQISNFVSIAIPPIDFSRSINNYIPMPPSIDNIKQFYDEKRENILIIWDFRKGIFGDIIKYEIKSSNKSKPEQISELPYKVPILSFVSTVTLNIGTISIIDGKKYKGTQKSTIIVNV